MLETRSASLSLFVSIILKFECGTFPSLLRWSLPLSYGRGGRTGFAVHTFCVKEEAPIKKLEIEGKCMSFCRNHLEQLVTSLAELCTKAHRRRPFVNMSMPYDSQRRRRRQMRTYVTAYSKLRRRLRGLAKGPPSFTAKERALIENSAYLSELLRKVKAQYAR